MAERYWPGGKALGKRLHWASPESDWPWLTIVGIAGDACYLNLDTPRFDIYVPFQQEPHWSMDFVLRTRGSPLDLEEPVRLALGANRGHVLRLVLRQGLGLILAGLALGLVTALGVLSTGLVDGLLHGIRPLDVVTFTTVPLLLLAAGLAASLSPALHATEVEPWQALRGD